MSHAATLATAVRSATLVPPMSRVDHWRSSGHRAVAAARHAGAALTLVPCAVRPFTAAIPTPPRERPRIDVRIEVSGTHSTVHQHGRSVVIAGAGEDLCGRLLFQMVHEAEIAQRPIVVVVLNSGEEIAMTVHPCGSVEELSLCCA